MALRLRLGLGARLAIAFALLAAVTALVTAGAGAYSSSRQINADVDAFLLARSLDIAEGRRADLGLGQESRPPRGGGQGGQSPVSQPQGAEVRSLVESDAEVQIVGREGDTVSTSGVGLPFEAIDAPFLQRRGIALVRTVEVEGESYRMVTRHVEGGGAVQVARSLTSTNAILGQVRAELLPVALAMSGLAGLIGWAIAQQTTKPLRKLTRTVETVTATEDLSTPIALDRTDEIGRLSEEFDSMLKTLGASRDQQQRLVQDAAHELRTPLTSVRANIDFLERAADLPVDDRQSTLASIKAELAELSSVLAEVVELATESRGAANFQRLDLAGVAEAALAQFGLRSDREVFRDLTPSTVLGDRASLVRAAQNLIGNADKYSPAGLAITVGVLDGSLWVSDQGPGIDVADRTRVFDRFYRSDRDRSAPGSGLGLAIVAKAALEHGGTAWVSDASTGGAKVGFTLTEAPPGASPVN